jgi:hypothetical protein
LVGEEAGKRRREERKPTPMSHPMTAPKAERALLTTVQSPKTCLRVGRQAAEETLPWGGSKGDAGIPKAVVKGEGVEGEAKLVVPDNRAEGGVNQFAVSFEEVKVVLAGRGTEESGHFARERGVLGGGVPLGPIVLGVYYHGLSEPPAPGSRLVGPREAFQVDSPILVPGGHVF